MNHTLPVNFYEQILFTCAQKYKRQNVENSIQASFSRLISLKKMI